LEIKISDDTKLVCQNQKSVAKFLDSSLGYFMKEAATKVGFEKKNIR